MANGRKNITLKSGSILLGVLILTFILSLFIGTIWKTTSYITDFVADQEHYIRMKNFETGLHQYVLSFMKENFQRIIERQNLEKKPLEIQLVWPPTLKKSAYTAIFTADATASLINCTITYKPDNAFKSKLAFGIERIIDESRAHFKITHWLYS